MSATTDQWICTDPSCNQYRREISENVFEFKEDRVINPVTGETESYQSTIDLDDYDWFQVVGACESFGYSTKQVDKWINEGEEAALIAECIFELEN